jgi:hypothetical protein
MKSVWTKGLKTKEEKEKRQLQLTQARDILDTLTKVLEDKELEALRATKPDLMDSGWPYRCADTNGYLRAVQEIKNILKE